MTDEYADALLMFKRRIQTAFKTFPNGFVWLRCAGLYGLFLAIAAPLGFWTGFLKCEWMIAPAYMYALVPLIAFLEPGILEELLFRVLWVPHPSENKSTAAVVTASAISLSVFVLMHPLNGIFVRVEARAVFTNPIFLILAALLGLVCTVAYRVSGSIWPPVAMHWMTVLVWTMTLGGKRLLSGG